MANYLIVGGSSGIGKALTKKLADAGNKVFASYYSNDQNQDADNITYFRMNVLDEVPLDFLPETIDGLAYCPGSINLRPFERIKPTDFIDDFNLQVVGAIKMIQVASARMKRSEAASIVLFSTVAVQTGLPFHTQVSTSKGALEGLTKALAAEYAPKIRVNCIAPSLTDTPLASNLLNSDQKKEANALRHPMKRIGSVDDIASAAEFLLSSKSSWITGQILHVDGGISSLRV